MAVALDHLEGGEPVIADFPQRYRQLCQQLSLARSRAYSPDLIDRLNRMVLRGHQQLYARPPAASVLLEGVRRTFPRAVRAERWLLLLATVLLVGTGAAMDLAVHLRPDLAYTVMDPSSISAIESMYNPDSDTFLQERPAESDLSMLGYYIRNNIGIGLRTFVSGIALGLGSIFFLVFNGIYMGAVLGHLDNVGFSSTIYPFIIGHGAFELTAIVLAGVAGLRLGAAVLAPGRHSRKAAVVLAAKRALPIVYGFVVMLVIAAFIESLWSCRYTLPLSVRYGVGAMLWAVVLGYLGLSGRDRAA